MPRSTVPAPVYTREAVLTIEQVAAALQTSVRNAERMHLPCVMLGARTRRFVWGIVLDELARRAAA